MTKHNFSTQKGILGGLEGDGDDMIVDEDQSKDIYVGVGSDVPIHIACAASCQA
jgi:hypothetical protein